MIISHNLDYIISSNTLLQYTKLLLLEISSRELSSDILFVNLILIMGDIIVGSRQYETERNIYGKENGDSCNTFEICCLFFIA